ncbi:MAG: Na+ dependent nucleoside transporter [Flavobacteriales bacterium]|nr:Na+ dependent nucleoside transporter [Flavobacteriales bacterium]MCB9165927.1 Na+ dependent nucleoside transporter [Flavobacteriales bacterium]
MRDLHRVALLLLSLLPLPVFAQGRPAPPEGMSLVGVFRGLLGLATVVGLCWIFSANRRNIPWHLVWKGLLFQLTLAILVLKVPGAATVFEWLSAAFVKVISFADRGSEFLFSSFTDGKTDSALLNFAFRVLPTIIYFSALMSLFYYLGVLQRFVQAFAWLMKRTLRISGAESLSAAGNIFLGQTESPLLIRPYLNTMTRSELLCVMVGGMATIAGGVLASYINFLGGDDPVQKILFAKHLLTASLMSAPAAVVAAKMLLPETEKYREHVEIGRERIGSNVLEAVANGTTDGIKLAVNVGAMLLVFTALIYFGNYILFKLGDWTHLNAVIAGHTNYKELSFQFILGYACAPLAWMLGVPASDITQVGQLLGEKTILNEFYAYVTLGHMKDSAAFASERSIIMATYILCGFANFASIGIQIGGIGALAPERRGVLSQLGLRALIGGTMACLFTAAIVGMLV